MGRGDRGRAYRWWMRLKAYMGWGGGGGEVGRRGNGDGIGWVRHHIHRHTLSHITPNTNDSH